MKIEKSKLIQILKEEMLATGNEQKQVQNKLEGLKNSAIRELDSCMKQKENDMGQGFPAKLAPKQKQECVREIEDELMGMLEGKEITFFNRRYQKLDKGTIKKVDFGLYNEYKKLYFYLELPGTGELKLIAQEDVVKI